MKLTYFFAVLGCLSIFACKPKASEEYTAINSQVDYKFIQFGEGDSPEIGNYIVASLTVCDQSGDTLHYVPNYPYFFQLKQSAIDSAWTHLHEGDSAVFRLNRKLFNQKFKFYRPALSDTGKLFLHFRLQAVYDKTEQEEAKQKAISKREVDEQAELKKYLSELNHSVDTIEDVYRIITHRNDTGTVIKYGAEVSIDYKGSFLSGYIFENTAEKGLTPTFKYGKEYQLIEGMHLGLSGLKSGESVKIILPSRRAFGKEGSLAGIVPPYTAVIFEVNIKKVKTNQ